MAAIYTINHTDSSTGSIMPTHFGTGDTVDLKYTMISNDCRYNNWEIGTNTIPLTTYTVPYVKGNATATSLTMEYEGYSPYMFESLCAMTALFNSSVVPPAVTPPLNTSNGGVHPVPPIYLATNNYVYWPPQDSKTVARQALWAKLSPNIRTRACPKKFSDGPDQIALETLREIISELEFRKYLRYGFILVRGDSGDTYQVFRNNSHVKVWRGGKLIEEICVRIKDMEIPDTDRCIAFKVAIEADEESFKKMGNRYNMRMAA